MSLNLNGSTVAASSTVTNDHVAAADEKLTSPTSTVTTTATTTGPDEAVGGTASSSASSAAAQRTPYPALFLSHGGGPCFYMDAATNPWVSGIDKHSEAAKWYTKLAEKELKEPPTAVVVFSAHWETDNQVEITSAAEPPLYYDYYGFPDFTYHLDWPAKGDTKLAQKIKNLVEAAGFAAKLNSKRGYDHGVFVPLKLAFPEPTFPVLQVSILGNLDPEQHVKLGKAVSSLRDEGVLIIGSGQATHGKSSEAQSRAFVDQWLNVILQDTSLTNEERLQKLINFETEAPHIDRVHPRTEHFIPLHVVLGATNGASAKVMYSKFFMKGSMALSHYRFD